MNAVTTTEGGALALRDEGALIAVLQSSLYPGAAPESIKMVLGYCKAAGLDPLQKPAHIVPMRCKTGEKDNYGNDKYAMRDLVMPGIGLYRIQAARTGQYAGHDEPKFGPMIDFTFNRVKREWVEVPGRDKKQPQDTVVEETMKYPEWCSVTVYRVVSGVRCAFTATEFWMENYATAGRDSIAPNEMWTKRARGQIAKCAEAQALRKAFPEIGAAPSAEEMEGKTFQVEDAHVAAPPPPAEPPTWPDDAFSNQLVRWGKAIAAGLKTHDDILAMARSKGALTEEQERVIRSIKKAPAADDGAPWDDTPTQGEGT